jgi:hypothetical protein
MQQDILEPLTDAVRAFNIRADSARRIGLPVVVEARCFEAPGNGCVSHLDVLRSMPAEADLTRDAQDEQCEVEIGLFSAAAEVNRLTDEARRKHTKIDLRVAHNWRVELVPRDLVSRGGAGHARRAG